MRILAFVLAFTWVGLMGQAARSEAELEPGLESGSQATAAAPAQPGTIARSTFTTTIVDREPQDTIQTLQNDQSRVYYFTELRGFEGQTITHRWEYEGKPVAEVFFEVRGPRWRVYSSKNLPEDALGQWSVSVVDDGNQVLRTDSLVYSAAAAPEPAEPAAPGGVEPSAAAKPAEPAPPAAPAEDGATPEESSPDAVRY